MPGKPVAQIPLPKGWPNSVKSAILHVIALAQFAMTNARGWAADSINTRVRLKAELDQANQDNALLREEMRIKVTVNKSPALHGVADRMPGWRWLPLSSGREGGLVYWTARRAGAAKHALTASLGSGLAW
jgi:hypothetical protein